MPISIYNDIVKIIKIIIPEIEKRKRQQQEDDSRQQIEISIEDDYNQIPIEKEKTNKIEIEL